MKKYFVKERMNENDEFKTIATYSSNDASEAISFAEGYATAFNEYKHKLNRPCVQYIDGYFWYNNDYSYILKVTDEKDAIINKKNF